MQTGTNLSRKLHQHTASFPVALPVAIIEFPIAAQACELSFLAPASLKISASYGGNGTVSALL